MAEKRYTKQMHRTLKYRLAAISLALTFCIFNVGLPIIVASCPMMKTSGASCCMQKSMHSGNSPVMHRTMVSGSCCKTVFAAERNTTEFLQVDNAAHAIDGGMVYTPLTVDVRILQDRTIHTVDFLADTSPPYTSIDLPVLFSSLLI